MHFTLQYTLCTVHSTQSECHDDLNLNESFMKHIMRALSHRYNNKNNKNKNNLFTMSACPDTLLTKSHSHLEMRTLQKHTCLFGRLGECQLDGATVRVVPPTHSTLVFLFVGAHLLVTAHVLQQDKNRTGSQFLSKLHVLPRTPETRTSL